MSKKVKKYRLFAMQYSVENVDYASSFRFSRATPDYILVYTQKASVRPPNGKAAEITEPELNRLSRMDEEWLFDCGISLFADIATRQKKEDVDRLKEMVNRLEEELEVESRKEVDET